VSDKASIFGKSRFCGPGGLVCGLLAFSSTACTQYERPVAPPPVQVHAAVTTYTDFAACIGKILHAVSPELRIEIAIGDIRDRTVPISTLLKPLSDGATEWARTIATRMGPGVRVLDARNDRLTPEYGEDNVLVFNGGWTQNDRVTTSSASRARIRFEGVEISLGLDLSYDLIAGDFNWRRYGSSHIDGVVSALAAVETSGTDTDLFLADGANGGAASVRI
jgi:hypothetical protein